MEPETEYEPRILAFLCNWCSYAGADLAGVGRNQYPTNVRVIRLMCSGRVDPVFVLDALIKGVDGVLILGCHLGDCHYSDGNYEAKIKYEMLKEILKFVNMDHRIDLNWVSAAEGLYFANIITKFTEKIQLLGPNPIVKKTETRELEDKLQAIKQVVSSSRVRKLIGREREITSIGNVYDRKKDIAEFKALLTDILHSEFIRNLIQVKIHNQPSSAKEIAQKLNYDPKMIFEHFLVLQQRGLIELEEIKGLSPIYKEIPSGKITQ